LRRANGTADFVKVGLTESRTQQSRGLLDSLRRLGCGDRI
jgi:hypothetical protein